MRITGWHVDGYGRFHDRGWDDLPAGLTVFHGPNEAGKSTLLSFLRSMLFGLKVGNVRDPAIKPLAGGRHGGVLRIADEEEAAWTVERYGRDLRILDAAGTAHDDFALRRLLGNIGRNVFEAVFAFSLTELEALGGLDHDALREQLFAASMTGGGSSAHEALGRLQKRVDRVYRPRGDSPLKALDDRLKELRVARRDALDGQSSYASLRRREDELGGELADLDARLTAVRHDRERLERLDRIWALLDPLERERGELTALSGGPTVRAADVSAAREADRDADAARARLDGVDEQRERTADRRSSLVVDPALLAAAEPLRALEREVPTQRERLLALSGLRGERDRRTVEAQDAVGDLGAGWGFGRVGAIDASLPVRRTAERHAEAVVRTREAAAAARLRAAQAERHADGAAEEVARLSATLGDGDPGPSVDALDRAAAALPEVRGVLQDLIARRDALALTADALDGLRAQATRPARSARLDGDRARVSVLLLVAVVSVAAGIGMAIAGQPLGGLALVVAGLLVLWVERTARRDGAAAAEAEAAADAEAHADRVRRHEQRIAGDRGTVERLERRLRDLAPVAGIDAETLAAATSTVPVEQRVAEVDTRKATWRAREARAAELEVAERAAESARTAADEAQDGYRDARAAAQRAVRAWRSWSVELGIPDGVPAEDTVPLLQAVERAQDAVRASVDAGAAVRDAEEALAAWSARAAETLVVAGRAPSTAADDHHAILDTLASAHTAAEETVGRASQRFRLAEQDADDAAEAQRLHDRVVAESRRRDSLLAAHGVSDVDALERARVDTDRREALARSVAERESAVRAAAGGGAAGEALIDEARTGDVTGWAARRAEHDADLPRLDEQRTAVIAARTDAVREREALEASVDLPRIDGEIEQTRADAARLLAELRTTVRARELIARTLDTFVRDRQPTVLRDASTWLQRITDGRYTHVRQTLQDRRGKQAPVLQVVPAHGATLDPTELSRGTREQLYLALRLALARRTARDATPLPLVMDDVLVNFSPDRARAVADVVAEVASEQQVLFFTCHPGTRDLLVRAAAARAATVGGRAARVEELGRTD